MFVFEDWTFFLFWPVLVPPLKENCIFLQYSPYFNIVKYYHYSSVDSTNTKMAVGTEEGFVCLLTITEEGPEYLKVLDKQVCGWFRFLDEIVKHSVHYRPVALEGKKYYFWKWDFSH